MSSPRLRGCNLQVSRKSEISFFARKILGDASHVLRPTIARKYADLLYGRKSSVPQPLQLRITALTMGSRFIPVVKHWMKRRYEQAILKELKRRGFNKRGDPIAPSNSVAPSSVAGNKEDGVGQLQRRPPAEQLIGSVNLDVQAVAIDHSWPEIQQQAATIVEEIIQRCGFQKRLDSIKATVSDGQQISNRRPRP